MDSNYSPIYLLRQYAWKVLKNNTNMREIDYDTDGDGIGIIPIVPLSEEPELTGVDKPYLVYGYALSGTGDLYARKTGSMTFVVYSTRFTEIAKILTILETAFGRQDESARDINQYTSGFTNVVNGVTTKPFIGIRFGYVRVGFVEGGSPEGPGSTAAETEGGRESGLINITFEYYVDYAVKTKVSEFTV